MCVNMHIYMCICLSSYMNPYHKSLVIFDALGILVEAWILEESSLCHGVLRRRIEGHK